MKCPLCEREIKDGFDGSGMHFHIQKEHGLSWTHKGDPCESGPAVCDTINGGNAPYRQRCLICRKSYELGPHYVLMQWALHVSDLPEANRKRHIVQAMLMKDHP